MTEEEARSWVRDRFGVSRGTLLDRFAALLKHESSRQNLISAASFDTIWVRHFVDSAQLIDLAAAAGEGEWIDVGTGAGMPGLVVAALIDRRVVMVEPRTKRVDFLNGAVEELGIAARVTVVQGRIETYRPAKPAAVISARAVAELSQLFAAAHHCSAQATVWLLPKGRSAQSEVVAARAKWQGSFHVEQSVTAPESGIVVARRVRPQ